MDRSTLLSPISNILIFLSLPLESNQQYFDLFVTSLPTCTSMYTSKVLVQGKEKQRFGLSWKFYPCNEKDEAICVSLKDIWFVKKKTSITGKVKL
uniref:Uncharacterized protein n=1 Tax=Arundo donax TaxID=35708 RepID=A0A0A9BU81_ARUDO